MLTMRALDLCPLVRTTCSGPKHAVLGNEHVHPLIMRLGRDLGHDLVVMQQRDDQGIWSRSLQGPVIGATPTAQPPPGWISS
jgi:hypothetical protein